ncbi:O-antigen ligase family protein [Halomonas halocynthiae]|uniref:O-antigen ligase family protein n=1 Tax=Halomonas halocynthiae TaxID=176290 RepID=UPI000411AEC7|nr:O-antigen ligase family protein [Halomonas halocynthiae]
MRFSNRLTESLWQRPEYWACPRPLWAIGVTTLLFYAGFRVLWPAVGSNAESISALFGLVAVLVYGRGIRSSAPLWLLLAALLVQCLSWWLGYQHHPEWVADNPQVDRLAKLFIFIAVAWWLGGSTRNTLLVWGCAVIGFFATTFFVDGAYQDWLLGLKGTRVDFGIRNAQHSSMMFGVILMALVILAPRLLRDGKWRLLRGGAWVFVLVFALVGVLVGQTRAVWLGLALAMPLVLIAWTVYHWIKRGGAPLRWIGAISLVAVLVIGLAVALLGKPVANRLAAESDVVEQVVSGQFDSIPYTSIGIRINTWRAGVEWIAERPMVGWGGEGRSLAIKHTEWLPDDVKAEFGHLHNYFLEMWVAYGLLGLAVIFALTVWIGYGCWRSWRAGVLPGDLALFGAAFFIYWVVVNQFESYNSFWTGVYMHNLVVGGLVTHIWRWQRQQTMPQQQLTAGRSC